MNDIRQQLVELDRKLGGAWAKVEILLGLLAVGIGLMIVIGQVLNEKQSAFVTCGGIGLIIFGGYLALAGHRSHIYRWNNRNTVTLIEEIRQLKNQGQLPL